MVTDSPFAEKKSSCTAFTVDCASLDELIEAARLLEPVKMGFGWWAIFEDCDGTSCALRNGERDARCAEGRGTVWYPKLDYGE